MVNNDLAKTNPTEYLHELFAKYHLKDPLLHTSQDPLGYAGTAGVLGSAYALYSWKAGSSQDPIRTAVVTSTGLWLLYNVTGWTPWRLLDSTSPYQPKTLPIVKAPQVAVM